VNISLTGVYNKCNFGKDWEWYPYKNYYQKAKIFPVYIKNPVFTWRDDFEQPEFLYSTRYHTVSSLLAYNGKFVSIINGPDGYSDGFGAELSHIMIDRLWEVQVDLKCYFTGPPGKTVIVCSINDKTGIIYYQTYRFDNNPGIQPGAWNSVQASFKMDAIPPLGFLKVYVWVVEGGETYIDDLSVKVIGEKE
jgi:hypothetical protein